MGYRCASFATVGPTPCVLFVCLLVCLFVCLFAFARAAANDRIACGMSTFFVELHETAAILRQGTARSLVRPFPPRRPGLDTPVPTLLLTCRAHGSWAAVDHRVLSITVVIIITIIVTIAIVIRLGMPQSLGR